jgi:hypothetical protein
MLISRGEHVTHRRSCQLAREDPARNADRVAAYRELLDRGRSTDAVPTSVTIGPDGAYEGDFAITITLEHGKGVVGGFLAANHHDARLVFDGVEIDQSYLQETERQLRSLLTEQ